MRRRTTTGDFDDRAHELGELESALRAAAAGTPRVVVLAADAGVGKTCLLSEFAAGVDGRVLWGTCLPMGGPVCRSRRSCSPCALSGPRTCTGRTHRPVTC